MHSALVIDDSRTMRSILTRKLVHLGFRVSQAENGKVALDLMRDGLPVSLMLVDWNMPVMNGVDFVRAVRANANYENVTIVMVTTETETSQVLTALDAGADDYIMKPFTDEIIGERLMSLGFQDSAA